LRPREASTAPQSAETPGTIAIANFRSLVISGALKGLRHASSIAAASRTDAALAQRSFDLKWLQRWHGRRALIVTSVGRRGLNDTFGLPL